MGLKRTAIYLGYSQTWHLTLLLPQVPSNFIACLPSHLDGISLAFRHAIHENGLLYSVFLIRLQSPSRLRLETQRESLCNCYLKCIFCNRTRVIVGDKGDKPDGVLGAARGVQYYLNSSVGNKDVIGLG